MELRFRLLLLSLVAIIAAAVWTFPLWRGVFRERSDNDPFPGLSLDLQEQFLALPPAQRTELLDMHSRRPDMAREMVMIAIDGDTLAPNDDFSGTLESARALVSGDFIEIDALHWGTGKATVFQLPDARYILRFENFNSAPGADVRIYLARDPQPLTTVELGNDFLDLGRLKGNIGDQSYFLSDNHNWSIYKSAVVYCRQFNTVITVATLR